MHDSPDCHSLECRQAQFRRAVNQYVSAYLFFEDWNAPDLIHIIDFVGSHVLLRINASAAFPYYEQLIIEEQNACDQPLQRAKAELAQGLAGVLLKMHELRFTATMIWQ